MEAFALRRGGYPEFWIEGAAWYSFIRLKTWVHCEFSDREQFRPQGIDYRQVDAWLIKVPYPRANDPVKFLVLLIAEVKAPQYCFQRRSGNLVLRIRLRGYCYPFGLVPRQNYSNLYFVLWLASTASYNDFSSFQERVW